MNSCIVDGVCSGVAEKQRLWKRTLSSVKELVEEKKGVRGRVFNVQMNRNAPRGRRASPVQGVIGIEDETPLANLPCIAWILEKANSRFLHSSANKDVNTLMSK